jgi:hypothetical protein
MYLPGKEMHPKPFRKKAKKTVLWPIFAQVRLAHRPLLAGTGLDAPADLPWSNAKAPAGGGLFLA